MICTLVLRCHIRQRFFTVGSKPETVSDTEHDLCGRENYNTERKSHFFFFKRNIPTPLSADSFWSLEYLD